MLSFLSTCQEKRKMLEVNDSTFDSIQNKRIIRYIFKANFCNKSMSNFQYIDSYGSSDYSRNLVLQKPRNEEHYNLEFLMAAATFTLSCTLMLDGNYIPIGISFFYSLFLPESNSAQFLCYLTHIPVRNFIRLQIQNA